jgi:hypothetical protein
MALAAIVAVAIVALRIEGHRWWCRCGRFSPWSGNIHSKHNSQHLIDPYSFTHILHGFLLYALLRPLAGRLSFGTRVVLALALESLWEILENSEMIIERYRKTTIALGYAGDSVLNSVGDMLACFLGFLAASRLPVRWSVGLFVLIEASLLLVYRDCLTLNVLMLVYPIETVKSWQMGLPS